jgi:hypothetical protein
VLLLTPAGARAATAPAITQAPAISGTPRVGEELVAAAVWTGDPTPTAAWAWLRCTGATGGCAPIAGAATERYRIAGADIGAFLRVGLKITNSVGSNQARSKPTIAIVAAPLPTPTPTATPDPTATAPPEPATAPAVAAVPETAAIVAPAAALVPLVFDPFPVVRIKGLLTAIGARVTVLSVQAPRDVRIQVDCTGSGCPTHHYEAPAGKHRLRKFERDLKAGTRLEVRVTKPGYVGKFTSFVIRRRAEPRRTDRCLDPGATRPVRCAAR